jgi:CheY-like chemotaxis protein/HPt (histidine-containing phosphotransfer) domain-containing protein
MGDAVRVRQVLVNLASNAIKYTDQGSVSIHLSVDTSTRLISATVTDSGLGIDPARLDSLFEPFVQVRGSDRAKGTGLGLAICERLTSLMGGSLTVDSTPDCGSSFEFSFPWVDVVLGTASESAHDDDHSGSGHVLVVEDSPVNQLLAKSQLERLGYRCSIASNGEEALEMLSTDAFDLVLMDWHMPGIDGLETTRRYRATESRWDHTPIVAMTAAALQGDRESCLAAGMDDFLPKPVSIRALGTMLERWVERTEVAQDTTHVPVDGSVLRAMVADLGDASTVISVAQTFLLELPARRDTIVNGLTNHELADARRAAHTLRSTSAMLGARSLEAICRSIESIDEAHDDLDWDALLEQFTQAAEDIQNDLPNHLSTLEGAR